MQIIIFNKELELYSYHMRIEVKESKSNEFISFLSPILDECRKEEGCLDFYFSKDIETENIYCLTSNWSSKETMENHFKRKNHSLLIGAAKVLGESFKK